MPYPKRTGQAKSRSPKSDAAQKQELKRRGRAGVPRIRIVPTPRAFDIRKFLKED